MPDKKNSHRPLFLFLKSALLPITIFVIVVFGIGNLKYAVGLFGFNHIYSEGVRVGQVLKLSERGLFWKTHEGSLGLTQSGAYVEKWDFSIDATSEHEQETLLLLSEAIRTGNLVEISYSQRIGVRPWWAKTSYIVKDVMVLR
jgi:hypothetical protein